MIMPIYSKSCPHCKNGDVIIEEFTDKTIGTQRAARCFQCGWQKIFPLILQLDIESYDQTEVYTSM